MYKSCGITENVPGPGNMQYRSNLISEFLWGLLSSQMATVRRDRCQLSDHDLKDTENGCFFLKKQKANLNLCRVATGQGKVREMQGQGKVREFCAGSGKFEILRKVREIQENPLKVREI